MSKTKIKDKKTGAIIEVKSSLASDFIGTGRYEYVTERENRLKFTDKKTLER